jgi:hypothetical protein
LNGQLLSHGRWFCEKERQKGRTKERKEERKIERKQSLQMKNAGKVYTSTAFRLVPENNLNKDLQKIIKIIM